VVDWRSVLLGPGGVARNGALADEARAAQREEAYVSLASALAAASGSDVGHVAGSGAAGGLGATLQALLGARLRPLFGALSDYLALEPSLETTDLVLLVDGETPPRTPRDSALAKVAREAKLRGIPVFALGIAPDGGPGRGLAADLFLHVEPQRSAASALATICSRSLVRAAEEAMHLARTGRFARDASTQV
jgi:glycerate kinase